MDRQSFACQHSTSRELSAPENGFLRSSRSEEKPSTISTAKLRRLLALHVPPIQQVVYLRSYLPTQ